jgi:hypothetical protein
MDLRKLARDQHCQVRLPGICNFGSTTTVLAHYRLIGYSGAGLKPPDDMGAFCCSSCHDAVDFRVQTNLPRSEIRLAHAEGVLRTQQLVKGMT